MRVTTVISLSLAINSLFQNFFFFPFRPKPLVVVLSSQTKLSIPSSSSSPPPLQQIKFPYHRLPPNKEPRQLCMALEVTFSPPPFFIYFFPPSPNLCTSLWLQCSHAAEKETKSHKGVEIRKAARGDTECQVTRVAGSNTEQCCSVFSSLCFCCLFVFDSPFSSDFLDAAGIKDVEMESQNPGIVTAAQAPPETLECFQKPVACDDVPTCDWLNGNEQTYKCQIRLIFMF